jgi:enterochelin esterase-like enzyme
MRAVVLLPRHRGASERFPLLVAMHGLGESLRGVERGAWGWSRDYELGASDQALRRGRLGPEAFLGLVAPSRLDALRAELRRVPYRGLVVVAPYTPDVLRDVGGVAHQAYERWVVEALVPRARAMLPVLATREATGIDGVSLGGLHALWIGLAHPETFGAVGALQPAVRGRQDLVAARYAPAATRPAQRVRLVTSDRDVLRDDVQALSDTFRARGIAHELRVVVGPHDYVFNRGPGGIEMLLFHDRALRGEASP